MEHDLYFKIIYLCIKYESSTLMFSKDIKRKLFFNIEKRVITPKTIDGFCPKFRDQCIPWYLQEN